MSNFAYLLTPAARADLNEIWDSISDENLEAADRVLAAIYEHIALIAGTPGIGHMRPDLAGKRSLLFSPVHRYKYQVIYMAQKRPLAVIGILHSARDIQSLLRHRKSSS